MPFRSQLVAVFVQAMMQCNAFAAGAVVLP